MLGEAVSIVHLDDELVVVHKPPSVPVSFGSSFFKRLSQITSGEGEWMTTRQSSLPHPLNSSISFSKLFALSRQDYYVKLLRSLHSPARNITVESNICNYFSKTSRVDLFSISEMNNFHKMLLFI